MATSTTAGLVLTLLFVADDPTVPSVVVDVAEDATGRRADVVVVAPAAPAHAAHLVAPPVEGSVRLRAFPVPPAGIALAPAVDGVLVTVEDVGGWQPGASPPPLLPARKGRAKAEAASPKSTLPKIPVADARSLRLLVPTVVDDGAAVPAPVAASLHGTRGAWPGRALVVTRRHPVLALSVAAATRVGGNVDVADGSVPVIADEAPGLCAPIPRRVLQRVTHLDGSASACSGALIVSPATGTRLAEQPASDTAAHGVVLQRR
jgi:hypothetical protein